MTEGPYISGVHICSSPIWQFSFGGRTWIIEHNRACGHWPLKDDIHFSPYQRIPKGFDAALEHLLAMPDEERRGYAI